MNTIKKNADDYPLSKRIRNSVDFRRNEIKNGKLEVEEGTPVDQIDYHCHVDDVDKKMIDIPTTKDDKTKETTKAYSPFSDPTKYPILKNIIR